MIIANVLCGDGEKNNIYNEALEYDKAIKNGTSNIKYTAKYRILTSTSNIANGQENGGLRNQKLIVVTWVSEEKDDPTPIDPIPDDPNNTKHKVSLEKYISKVNNQSITGRENNQEYIQTIYDFDNNGSFSSEDIIYIKNYYSNISLDENIKEKIKKYGDVNGDGNIDSSDCTILMNSYAFNSLLWKYNNVVEVLNGDNVEYTIKVTNNGETNVYVTKIADYLPNGVKYNNIEYSNNVYNTQTGNKVEFDNLKNTLLKPGESASFTVNIIVTENNMSTNILKNVAEITELKDEDGNIVTDSTPEDNKDADYMQMKDITISGIVWNDKALTKVGNEYNGVFDIDSEKTIEGIKVTLKRVNDDEITEVANTVTDENGSYKFEMDYIKGPKVSNTNRWAGTYFSYIIEFKYDGITYTATKDSELNKEEIKSNAKEDLELRTEFNKKFSTINNKSEIEYTTKNENGFIPQSIHVYNEETMNMTSKTDRIELSNNDSDLSEKLKNINLGLRGRDIFDLELICNIQNIKININGKEGIYNSNKVELRNVDILSRINATEDMANILKEQTSSNSVINNTIYNVRNSDNSYCTDIKVTYKISIQNASKSRGTATKIIDYFDTKYTFVKAYNENGNLTSTVKTFNDYNAVIVSTEGRMLEQSEKIDIYLEFKINNISEILTALKENKSIPTFNMAEIYEYKTECGKNQTEFTRGLLEKDSAPGSVGKEKVRLNTKGNVDTSTLKYYFNGDNLALLKYEDDTYVMPVIYFVSSNNERKLTGTVFRDSTTTDNVTKIKTGNGKIDSGEVGVFGATVELIEQNTNTIYKATTDESGVFTISGFIPGNYIVKYSYGDTKNTVLLNKSEDGKVNNYSYNGSDYQSTNNTGTYNSSKLNNTEKYWYLVNETEGISVATDNALRRNTVSENIVNFTEEKLMLLNNTRNLSLSEEECKIIIENTSMFADSNIMDLGVEKYVIIDNKVMQSGKFGAYEIGNMNFGISEVPVTIIDLQKHVKSFKIVDSTGKNVLASMEYKDGKWVTEGDVLGNPTLSNNIDVSIEDNKLQGAKLQITYEITSNIDVERDFKNTESVKPTIKNLVDYIKNNLSFNSEIAENAKYWEKTEYSGGAIDSSNYINVVKATKDNPIITNKDGKASATIVLEQVLTAEDITIEQIITSNVETFEFSNSVEITELDYTNVIQQDRIRNNNNFIMIAGRQYNTASSETISIHPPTGNNSLTITSYIKILACLIVIIIILLIKKHKKY